MKRHIKYECTKGVIISENVFCVEGDLIYVDETTGDLEAKGLTGLVADIIFPIKPIHLVNNFILVDNFIVSRYND